MTTTTYYDLNIVEGTNIVNPLTVDNPNYVKIDEAMHDNAVSGVTLATEIANAKVHAIVRENPECAVIRFIATSAWKAGDTVTVDGVPVTALLPSGETLPDGAYVINANVLCILTGTYLTVYAERKKVDNANQIAYNDTTVSAALNTINTNLGSIGNFVETTEALISGSLTNSIGNILNNLTLTKGTWIVISCGEIVAHSTFPYNLAISVVSGNASISALISNTPVTTDSTWADFSCIRIVNALSDGVIVGNVITPYANDVVINSPRMIAIKISN